MSGPLRPQCVGARRVVVLGGGLAGITAALDCAQAGAAVTLIEVRPQLGGAAYSFQRDGLWLDNGQHVFLRCYTAYRGLLERLGSAGLVEVQPRFEITVVSPQGKCVVLRRSALPAPFHLMGALARYSHLSLRQRVQAGRAALALARLDVDRALDREREDGTTLGAWLAERGQSPVAVAQLWDLIMLPALNLPAAEGSLALGAFTFQTGLLERNDAGDIGFHARPFRETLDQPAERALRRAGVEVWLGARAEGVQRCTEAPFHETERQGFLVHAAGKSLRADAVVCALPHQRAAGLLESLLGGETTRRWQRLGESPIVNVHVVYDRRVCDLQFAAGVGTPVQYVFDRSAAAGLDGQQYLAVSLSGAQAEMETSPDRLRERYLKALADLFPRARDAVVRHFHISREHAATFRAAPGVQGLRPQARTSVPGLVLAGAWTDTGWPATLEGAVLSGHAASREVLGQNEMAT